MEKKKSVRLVKCPKCQGTGFYSGRFIQHACEVCFNGKVSLKEKRKYYEKINRTIEEI